MRALVMTGAVFRHGLNSVLVLVTLLLLLNKSTSERSAADRKLTLECPTLADRFLDRVIRVNTQRR